MKKGIIGLMLMACAMSACQKDVSDPNYNPNLGASVPDGFEWSTTKTLNVNVEVKDEYNGKYYYAVRVYDKTPGEGILPVAASGKVNQNMPFSQKIVIPATVTKLYIAQVLKNANASETVTMKEVAVEGTMIDCSFGSSSKTRSAVNTRDDDNNTVIVTDPSQIEGGKNKVYKIKESTTITLTSTSGNLKDVNIIIEGTLVINEKASLHEWNIDVEDSGKLIVNGNLELVGNKNDTGKSSSLENNGYVHVTGDLHVAAGAQLDNDDNDDGRSPGGCIIVDGEAHFQSNKIELDERSYMYCGSLRLNASDMKITMETGAWLRVEGSLTSANNCEIGFGDDYKFEVPEQGDFIEDTEYVGLLQVGSWGNNGKDNLTVRKEILVESPQRGSHNIESWTKDATDMIVIIGTECSGGFGDDETALPGNFTYIFEDMYPEEGDYDMNDLVVSLTATQKGKTVTISGELKAVGASYAIIPYIEVNKEGKPLLEIDGKAVEAHAILGNTATSSLINTIKGGTNLPAKAFTLKFDNVTEKLNMDDIIPYIEVDDRKIYWYTKGEKATWGMRIPDLNFKWAQERVKIINAYPKFNEWFTNPASDWYNYPKSDLIY